MCKNVIRIAFPKGGISVNVNIHGKENKNNSINTEKKMLNNRKKCTKLQNKHIITYLNYNFTKISKFWVKESLG